MTQKILTKNFRLNFKQKAKDNTKVMILLFVLHLVSAPLNLINLMSYTHNKEISIATNSSMPTNISGLYVAIGVIATSIAAFIGIAVVLNNFKYLYKKSVVDMTLSLPLTTNQRFFSDFLSGLFTYLMPFIATSIISLIINGVAKMTIPNWSNALRGVNDMTKAVILAIVSGFFIMLMLYVLTLLVITCCGNLFESFCYSIIVNAIIPGIILTFGYIFLGSLYGIEFHSKAESLVNATSPIGGVISLYNTINKGISFSNVVSLLIFFLVTVIYFIASYFIYTRRKAEQVSRPFVYKTFYYVVVTAVTFCLTGLFIAVSTDDFIIPLIIVSAIIYFIFDVIANRGLKRFYVTAIRYVATISCVVGIYGLINATDGFGTVLSVPKAVKVESIEMSYCGIFKGDNYNFNTSELFDDIYGCTYTNEETIQSVVNMHNKIIERYRDDTNTSTESGILIKYNMKSGNHIVRTYSITPYELLMLKDIDMTEEFKKNREKNILSVLKRNNSYSDIMLTTHLDMFRVSDFLFKPNTEKSILEEFLNCLVTDINSLSYEEYYKPTSDVIYCLSIYTKAFGRTNYNIYENYINTMRFIDNNRDKMNIPTLKSDLDVVSNEINMLMEEKRSLSILRPEDLVQNFDGQDIYTNITNFNAISASNAPVTDEFIPYLRDYPKETIDKVTQLLSVSQNNYISNEPCYAIVVDKNRILIIPPQYSELAQQVYSELKQ